MDLLTRDQFREAVFARDRHTCVVCNGEGQDAHHIMERRLWPDGGYYLANGATLCADCHVAAEQTWITPWKLRQLAGDLDTILPPHLYTDAIYDKWGNQYVNWPTSEVRMPGELFDDPSVQKVLADHLHLFADRIKYPRTYHLPWSPGTTSDDRIMADTSQLESQPLVVTIKMDGEQTTIYPDGLCHARSLDTESHESRHWVRALAARVGPELPKGYRICGENLWAKHSIHYLDLPDYFLMFSLWNGLKCLGWEETCEWAELLGLQTVPELKGESFATLPELGRILEIRGHEGYVVRVADSFHYKDFRLKVGKWVRKEHVHTHGHWMREQIVRNLKAE